jgi:histidine ammonia-lyase
MGANAAVKALEVVENVQTILAIEMLVACQALHLQGLDGLGSRTKKVYEAFRKNIPAVDNDRELYDLIELSKSFIDELNPSDFLPNG